MLKKIFIAFLLTLCVVGCTTNKKFQTDAVSSTNSTMSSSFNEETYIWENWIFPTNKTTGK